MKKIWNGFKSLTRGSESDWMTESNNNVSRSTEDGTNKLSIVSRLPRLPTHVLRSRTKIRSPTLEQFKADIIMPPLPRLLEEIHLPQDILACIMQFLGRREKKNLALVNKAWLCFIQPPQNLIIKKALESIENLPKEQVYEIEGKSVPLPEFMITSNLSPRLEVDVINRVLAYLDGASLTNLSLVNKAWLCFIRSVAPHKNRLVKVFNEKKLIFNLAAVKVIDYITTSSTMASDKATQSMVDAQVVMDADGYITWFTPHKSWNMFRLTKEITPTTENIRGHEGQLYSYFPYWVHDEMYIGSIFFVIEIYNADKTVRFKLQRRAINANLPEQEREALSLPEGSYFTHIPSCGEKSIDLPTPSRSQEAMLKKIAAGYKVKYGSQT